MATMQGYMSGQEAQLDELPSWKRDLILRKRANVRMHGGFGIPTPTPSSMAGRGRGSLSGRPPLSSTLSGPPSLLSGPSSSLRGSHQPVIRSVSGPSYSHSQSQNNNAVSPRLESVREGSLPIVSNSVGDESSNLKKCAVNSEIQSANTSNMHHKGLHDEGPRVTSPTYSTFSDTCENNTKREHNEEDFSYGPGIVSKLKNRYMSLAMRDNRSRPPLRKFSSLEDLLDDPRETWQETRGTANVARPRHHHNAQANNDVRSASHRREVMKRARSVDSLSSRLSDEGRVSSGVREGRLGMPKSKSATSRLQSSLSALQKDDVIIIEASRPSNKKEVNGAPTKTLDTEEPPPLTRKMSSSNMKGEPELPAPDTVRHVKKIFEPAGGRHLRGTKARVAAHKAQQAAKSNGTSVPTSKPAIKAKPTDIPPRKITPPAPAFPVTIEEAKSSLKQVAPVSRASPRATLSVRASSALNGGEGVDESVGVGSGGGSNRARPGLTPVTASVTAPLVNGGGEGPIKPSATSVESSGASGEWIEEGVRKISNTAVSSIRNDSHSQEFDFTRSSSGGGTPQSSSKVVAKAKPSSPVPINLPASPVVSHRVPSTTTVLDSYHQTTPIKGEKSPITPTKSEKSSISDQRVQQENLKNAEKSRGGVGVDKFEPHKVTKVDTVRSPTKGSPPSFLSSPKGADPSLKPSEKVEPHRPTPNQGKGLVSKSSGLQKTVFSQNIVSSPVDSNKTSSPFVSDDLVRSPGRGNLVEAFNKQPSAEVTSSPMLKTTKGRDWRGAQDNNTLVYNFTSSKKETPDYIENDGIDLSKRIPKSKQPEPGYVFMHGYDPRDSSTDGDDYDDPGTDYLDARPGVIPPPSGIVFEGEAVIINGRSNLQRQPKTKKLTISFDDAAQTYEYPSESSLIEENLPITASSDLSGIADTNTSTHGGLASYTPSKIQIGSSFELGVSRTAPAVQASPPTPSVQPERVDEEYLRPADESETVTWSAESTSDMLF